MLSHLRIHIISACITEDCIFFCTEMDKYHNSSIVGLDYAPPLYVAADGIFDRTTCRKARIHYNYDMRRMKKVGHFVYCM